MIEPDTAVLVRDVNGNTLARIPSLGVAVDGDAGFSVFLAGPVAEGGSIILTVTVRDDDGGES